MTIERFLGGITVLCGVLLLLYGIPAHVQEVETAIMSPRVFPQIAAWLFVVAGTVQFFFVKSKLKLPTRREFIRVLVVCALILAMTYLMDKFGYLVGAVSMMAVIMYMVYERRPLWLGIAIVIVPIAIWILFVIVLKRPLP
ncbi:MAG: tripartite tricarboxylate transporter TctB family protein [Alphaproteobacteria bacterium]|nr:tripartite tricarboxylate transporter TctB family protein [Alphaproteobacteria bacterium]